MAIVKKEGRKEMRLAQHIHLILIRLHLTYDQVNAGFEMVGAAFRIFDCMKLHRDKTFLGGSIWTAVFFFIWGIFNTFFYPSLGQTWSLCAAITLTMVNGLWIVMAVYFNYRELRRLAGLA